MKTRTESGGKGRRGGINCHVFRLLTFFVFCCTETQVNLNSIFSPDFQRFLFLWILSRCFSNIFFHLVLRLHRIISRFCQDYYKAAFHSFYYFKDSIEHFPKLFFSFKNHFFHVSGGFFRILSTFIWFFFPHSVWDSIENFSFCSAARCSFVFNILSGSQSVLGDSYSFSICFFWSARVVAILLIYSTESFISLFVCFIFTDGEYLFVDPDNKLGKYAPKGWKSSHASVSVFVSSYLFCLNHIHNGNWASFHFFSF